MNHTKPKPYEIFAIIYVQILWPTHSLFMTDYYGDLKQFRTFELNKENHLEIRLMWSYK